MEARGMEPHWEMVSQRLRSVEEVKPVEQAGAEAQHRMKARRAAVGYRLRRCCRKILEEGFGRQKAVARLSRTRVVGRPKLQQLLGVGAAAYYLVQMRSLAPAR